MNNIHVRICIDHWKKTLIGYTHKILHTYAYIDIWMIQKNIQ